jgi:hypothetical protein
MNCGEQSPGFGGAEEDRCTSRVVAAFVSNAEFISRRLAQAPLQPGASR